MSYTKWSGLPKGATGKDHRGGSSTDPPATLAKKLKAAGWTEVTLTVNGKDVTP